MAGTWSSTTNFPQPQFGDDPTQLLPDGRVLAGYISGPETYIYDPASDTWSPAGSKLRNDRSDEETWIKLPDDSILSYDLFPKDASTDHAQRYLPGLDLWVDAGTVPVPLSGAAVGNELGPAFLMPDGRAFFVGATGQTAFYSPSTNSWTAGPAEPTITVNGIPTQLVAADTPGAMMPNGHVLLAFSPLGKMVKGSYSFPAPTYIYEFDPTTNTYTNVTPTVYDLSQPAYRDRMLMLPSGEVLLTNGSNKLTVYTPGGSSDSSWKPTISNITTDGNGRFTLTGTQLNGISQGASYGDDAEMDTNYPIVRLEDQGGHVFYAHVRLEQHGRGDRSFLGFHLIHAASRTPIWYVFVVRGRKRHRF